MILALICGALASCQTDSSSTRTTAPVASGDGASLVIRRAANLGEIVVLSIDGAKVSEIRVGDTYTYNGSLSPGPHVISVLLEPNQLNLAPTKKSLTAEKGKTYTYTVMWQGDSVILK
jgi:hypothetical protein